MDEDEDGVWDEGYGVGVSVSVSVSVGVDAEAHVVVVVADVVLENVWMMTVRTTGKI